MTAWASDACTRLAKGIVQRRAAFSFHRAHAKISVATTEAKELQTVGLNASQVSIRVVDQVAIEFDLLLALISWWQLHSSASRSGPQAEAHRDDLLDIPVDF